jgi:hypothetical protein
MIISLYFLPQKASSYQSLYFLPKKASSYQLSINYRDGDEVIVETKFGAINQISHLNDIVDKRVISGSHGWCFPEGRPEKPYQWEKSNLNILTSTTKLGKEFDTPDLKAIGC